MSRRSDSCFVLSVLNDVGEWRACWACDGKSIIRSRIWLRRRVLGFGGNAGGLLFSSPASRKAALKSIKSVLIPKFEIYHKSKNSLLSLAVEWVLWLFWCGGFKLKIWKTPFTNAVLQILNNSCRP